MELLLAASISLMNMTMGYYRSALLQLKTVSLSFGSQHHASTFSSGNTLQIGLTALLSSQLYEE